MHKGLKFIYNGADPAVHHLLLLNCSMGYGYIKPALLKMSGGPHLLIGMLVAAVASMPANESEVTLLGEHLGFLLGAMILYGIRG